MSLIVLGFCYQTNAQSSPTALFTVVTNEKDVLINTEQSHRLQRIRDLPTTDQFIFSVQISPYLAGTRSRFQSQIKDVGSF